MLSLTLNTNELKNAAGTEVEFQSLDKQARSHQYALITESPSLPHRVMVSHQETGKGVKRRRRSMVRVDKTTLSTVDSVTPVTTSAYIVGDFPVGAITAMDEPKNVMAELGSFVFTTGGTSTFLYDGSGNGAQAILTGGL